MAVDKKTRVKNLNRMIGVMEKSKKKKGKDYASGKDLADLKRKRAALIKPVKKK